MYLCYGLSAVTLAGLTATLVQGLSGGRVLGAPHPTFSFLITIVYLFTETLVMFFFVGTGSNVKEFVRERKLPETLIGRIGAARHQVTMEACLSILLVLGTAVLGGATGGGNLHRLFAAKTGLGGEAPPRIQGGMGGRSPPTNSES